MSYTCSVCGKSFTNGIQDDKGNLYCSESCFETTLPHCDCCGKLMDSWTENSKGKFCSEKCLQSSYPKCVICGKPVDSGFSDSHGNIYCSDECYNESLPKCCVCGKSMREWIVSSDGKKYCGDECYNKTLPKCVSCGKPVNEGIITDDGRIFCNERCYEKTLPKCVICGTRVRNGYKDNKGLYYCSDNCYEESLEKCSVCGKPLYEGFYNEKGYFCSEECFNMILPKCKVCGKPVNGGYIDDNGNYYCSNECYEETLPKCNYCGKRLNEWLVTEDGKYYCNNNCFEQDNSNSKLEVEMETPLTAEELSYLTGLSTSECKHFMDVNHMDGDEAFEAIDIFMQSLNDDIAVPMEIASCINNAGIYTKMSNRLSSYNTMRGGTKGYGGFVFEELHAADAATKGVNINVLGNNGPADFIVKDVSGKEILVQAKAGYKPGQIDWSKYEDMTIVVDKGNTALANEARSMGLVVEESGVFKKQADIVARAQQWESKITGSKTAPITATATGAHYAGMASAKFAARVGVSTKLGENIYDVISGEKDFSDAVSDVAFDSVKLVGSAYVSGAALEIAGSAVSYALTGTAVGSAVTGVVGTAAAAVGSTAVGGAALTAAGTVASGVATAAAAVTGTAFLPVVAAGAAVGFISKWFRNK